MDLSDQAAMRAQIDSLVKTFHIEQQVQGQTWNQLQGSIPRRLYHYTTIDGLVGITSIGSMWASDVRFMNDASELSYAASLIDEIIREVLSGVTDGGLAELLPNTPGLANSFEYGARPFIACFCEVGDLLSQWRGYGSGEAPVSLGLDLSMLPRVGWLPKRTFLRKVIYKPEIQRQAVRAVAETWLGTNDNAGDRTYLVLAKPNVIMNNIRLRGQAVAGSDAAGRKSPHNHAQTARNLRRSLRNAAAGARLIQADGLDSKSAAEVAACLAEALLELHRLRRSLDRRIRRDQGRREVPSR